MNRLASFAKNPFLTIDISKNRFGKFVSDHIDRMKSHNNPVFASLILSTEALYASIFGNLENYDNNYNNQISLTRQVDQKIQEFVNNVLDMESLVCVKFKKKSATYQEFFPHGRTEYYRAKKKNILVLFERIIGLTTTYESALGSDWKIIFGQMYNEFKPVFSLQSEMMGSVSHASSDFKILKNSLSLQLYKNLLTLLAEYNENPKRALSCFDETIVNWRKHYEKDKENEPEK
jgi:hypothetical protein